MSSLRGPLFMTLAMAGFAIEDALIKALAVRVPVGQVALTLGLGGALVFWLLLRGRGLFTRRAVSGLVGLRNLSEGAAAGCMMLGIALVPLSVVSAILQVMPLAVTLAAAVILKEPVGWRRWSAIILGFGGVMLILRPGTAAFDWTMLLPLAAVGFLTVRDLVTRRLPGDVSTLQVSGWGFLAVIPAGLALLALRGEGLVMPAMLDWGLLLGCVAVGVAGYGALVLATRSGDIAVTTPFRYSRLVFAMLIGVVIFAERPDTLTLIGSAIVVVAGLYSLMREIHLKRREIARLGAVRTPFPEAPRDV